MSERRRPKRDAEIDQLALGGGQPAPVVFRTTPGPSLPQAYTNRYEIKYLISGRELQRVRRNLIDLMEPDANSATAGGYFNHSIYFDSPHYRHYTEKHEGQLDRIKPRLRFYRSALKAPATNAYLELKGRYDKIVAKRRMAVTPEMARALLSSANPAAVLNGNRHSVAGEFTYMAERFNLQPCVSVAYRREAFFSDLYKSLRITFDSGLLCSLATQPELAPESHLDTLPGGQCVLEVKYNNQIPKIFLSRLHSMGLQQRTFSKFAVSLERCFEQFRSRSFRASRFV